MKKQFAMIIILVITLSLLLTGCRYTAVNISERITVMEDDEIITQLSSDVDFIGAVSNKGNCYIRGANLFDPFYYGVSDIKGFNNTHGKQFVQIYDKGDAETITLSGGGGCITTSGGDVYLFLDGTHGWDPPEFENDELLYRTPELLCTGYRYAEHSISDGLGIVYLITEDNDLGYVTVEDPDDFHFIYADVKKIQNLRGQGYLVALTNDHQLLFFDSNNQYSLATKLFDNIIDFAIAGVNEQSSIALLDENHSVYFGYDHYFTSYLSSADKLDESRLYHKIGENIAAVTIYNYKGAAMLDYDGNVSIYGPELKHYYYEDDRVYNGEVVLKDVSYILGDSRHLFIVRSNGNFEYFGKLFMGWDDDYRVIVADENV